MAVTPDTIIHLLKVPIEIDEENQLTFASATAQYNYFISLPKKTEDDLQYQRKDNFIAWPDHIDNILQYNYVMYQNSNYSNKWFYAFITNMEYENDGMTKIYIEQDPFQTWQFDIIYKPSFIEREHTNDDTVGANIVDEGLAVGDYVCNKKNSLFHDDVDQIATNNYDTAIVVGVSEKLENSAYVNKGGTQYNGIYSALTYFAFRNNTFLQDNANNINALNAWIHDYAQEAKADAIYSVFMYPATFVESAFNQTDHHIADSNIVTTRYINSGSQSTINKEITLTQNTLDGYTPVNNKLLCYPYNYLTVSNNNGGNVVYKLEDFYTIANNEKTIINPKFIVNSCLTPRRKHKTYTSKL